MNIVVVASRSRSLFTSLREMLGQDFDLQFADRLSQVFDALAKGPTDLVFVDSRLADCEGRDAVREIASVFPETSLIYLVPPQDGRVCPVSEEKGVYAYLWKPLQKEIVHFLAGKAVERRKLARRIEYLSSLAGKGAAENSARPNDR
jgi:DNA-binding NtrC family response regulator